MPSNTSFVETWTASAPDLGCRARDRTGRLAVDPHGALGIPGAGVDVGPGGGIDHDLRPPGRHAGEIRGRGDVEVGSCDRQHLVAGGA